MRGRNQNNTSDNRLSLTIYDIILSPSVEKVLWCECYQRRDIVEGDTRCRKKVGKQRWLKFWLVTKIFANWSFWRLFLPIRIFKSFVFYCYFWLVTKIFITADFFCTDKHFCRLKLMPTFFYRWYFICVRRQNPFFEGDVNTLLVESSAGRNFHDFVKVINIPAKSYFWGQSQNIHWNIQEYGQNSHENQNF